MALQGAEAGHRVCLRIASPMWPECKEEKERERERDRKKGDRTDPNT